MTSREVDLRRGGDASGSGHPAWVDPLASGRNCLPRGGGSVYCAALMAKIKMKSNSSAKKRFKLTAKGKVRGRHAYSSHILEKKSPKRKRGFRKDRVISKADTKTVNKLLGGNGR